MSETMTLPDLVSRARTLLTSGERRILGLTGSPGAGKSTLAAALQAALGDRAALLPMDGFHLANEELRRLGRAGRKGAPDTFDVGGYAALLTRVRQQQEDVVYAPRFDRHLEESIGSALPVPRAAPLVITEGNYLLLDGPWQAVRAQLDDVWFLAPPDGLRRAHLIARHEAHGRDPRAARAWVESVDDANAHLIEAARDRADLVVRLDWGVD
ncbi:nucleoside/nucleotide kinase family protein [Deinococcus soli (ex Cha et al. 2016)]|uniref:Pantothenate kinase n=2 Tax=Deinococcus soli (ex Cha et al. 2016) TaxID=1309411 RepID=A0AAE3XBR6_9DEIO|nr:nucleoside/nucleotide kinase family protein [Deinococcus soli (ex Cha et al. 2016)]MDR6217749.1 pantothenate kinase [Deinococcus soli (ex Cha et al. 2016)]MDR6327999.1 pantothenate kinase [Deinococcus soli (ex Cha et al. 2016)]MDR6750851.1 pantothenate kinase [Deinococcus soli (ex Cha et al. 2016)]